MIGCDSGRTRGSDQHACVTLGVVEVVEAWASELSNQAALLVVGIADIVWGDRWSGTGGWGEEGGLEEQKAVW